MMDVNILEMKGITKIFPGGVKALDQVDFVVRKGEVHALLGENGAGKSTLMKILNGVYEATEGECRIDGEAKTFHSTKDASNSGIGLIFQELNLIPTLSAVENAFLGRLYANRLGFVKWKAQRSKFLHFLSSIGFELDVDIPVSELSIAEKQMVEIAKALLLDARILVMDEPTATLTNQEIKKLFAIIRSLKDKGVTVIYISHRLEEVFEICDRVTVLRDGKYICTLDVAQTDKPMLIEKMVGRSMDVEFPPRDYCALGPLLEVRHLFTPGFLSDIDFELHKCEILGIVGLVGSGRSEVARAIFGADRIEKGTFIINGKTVRIHSTMDAKRNSIGLVPEDRKEEGLALDFSLQKNITITSLKKVTTRLFINRKSESDYAERYIKALSIKTPSVNQRVESLSGGNQQKVVLAKWLYNEADILILDEPTRGIDVGAKYEIYVLMNELVKQGKSIILISSELPEIFALSDRILVMYEGRLKACLENTKDLRPEEIMKFAIG